MTIDISSLARAREQLHSAAAAIANALDAVAAAATPPPAPPPERRPGRPPTPESATGQAPLSVRPTEACRLLGCGLTYLYMTLIANGELDSYTEGRSRLITMSSIQRLQAKRLAEPDAGKTRKAALVPAHATLADNRRRRREVASAEPASGVEQRKP